MAGVQLPLNGPGTKLQTVDNNGVVLGDERELVQLGKSDGTVDTSIAALLSGLRGQPAGTLDAIRALLAATLQVAGAVTVSNLPVTQPVSGTVTANLGTIDGAATSAAQLPNNHNVVVTSAPTTAVTAASLPLPTGAAADATLPKLVGTWAYYAGASGTVNVAAGQRVVGIAVHATGSGATLTINSGQVVPIPSNTGIAITPQAQLVAPVLVLAGTDSYFIETVV